METLFLFFLLYAQRHFVRRESCVHAVSLTAETPFGRSRGFSEWLREDTFRRWRRAHEKGVGHHADASDEASADRWRCVYQKLMGRDCHTWDLQLKCSYGDLNDTNSQTLWQFVALKRWCAKTKELVAPKPKSCFVRQKVLGANIHETEGLLERNIALTRTRACSRRLSLSPPPSPPLAVPASLSPFLSSSQSFVIVSRCTRKRTRERQCTKERWERKQAREKGSLRLSQRARENERECEPACNRKKESEKEPFRSLQHTAVWYNIKIWKQCKVWTHCNTL